LAIYLFHYDFFATIARTQEIALAAGGNWRAGVDKSNRKSWINQTANMGSKLMRKHRNLSALLSGLAFLVSALIVGRKKSPSN
jgi:hypothetical protein